MSPTRVLASLVLVLFTPPSLSAGIDVWTAIGPPGGTVTGLAADPTIPHLVYAATGGGFFRSSDDGATWTASNDGLRDVHLQGVIVAGGAVYVGGADGVSRSDDHGLRFRRLAAAPTSVSALAAGTGTAPSLFAAGVFAGAWRSDDGGTTWTEIDEGLERDQPQPAAVVNAFLVHPRRHGLVWAASEFGIYRSLDSGAHWTRVNHGFSFVTSLALDAGGTLLAGCYVDPAFVAPPPPALFVSDDLGTSWHPAVHGLAARGVMALLADPSGAVWAGTQDAGVFRTTSHGFRWNPARTGIETQAIGALAQAPREPATLLAGSGLSRYGIAAQEGPGVFLTSSAGARWTLSSQGQTATPLAAVAAAPVARGEVTAAGFAGVWRTRSRGAAWRALDQGLPAHSEIRGVVADTVASGVLYSAVSVPGFPPLFRRDAGADTLWQPLTGVPPGCSAALTAGAGGRLFAGGFDEGGFVCASADGGATWRAGGVGFIVVGGIASAPANPLRVYAFGYVVPHAPNGPTFYRSDDGGATWTGEASLATLAAFGLAVDTADPDLVYAAVGAVERSRDGGVTWEVLLPGSGVALVAVDPHRPGTLYAASGLAGAPATPAFVVSDDGGATWQPLADGLPPNLPVVDLAFDPVDDVLYAATAGGGVFALERSR